MPDLMLEKPVFGSLDSKVAGNEPETGLVLSYRTTRTDFHKKQWNIRQKTYSNNNLSCQKHKIYNKREHTIQNANCNQYSCSRCRPGRKHRLLNAVIEVAEKQGLTRMLTITFPGRKYRNRVSPDDSFAYNMRRFNSLKIYLKRRLGVKLEYINFPRSQKDGYCHQHILIDRYIPKSVLDDICKHLGLGSTNIKYVDIHRIGGYLKAELNNKDHEWMIPKHKKHYSKSHGVTLDFSGSNPDCYFIEIPTYFSINQKIDKVYDIVNHVADRPPPFDFLLGMFQEVVDVVNGNWKYGEKLGYCWVYHAMNCPAALTPTPYVCPKLLRFDKNVRINVFGSNYTPVWRSPKTRQKKFVKGDITKL